MPYNLFIQILLNFVFTEFIFKNFTQESLLQAFGKNIQNIFRKISVKIELGGNKIKRKWKIRHPIPHKP